MKTRWRTFNQFTMKKTVFLAAALVLSCSVIAQKEAASTISKEKTEQAEKEGNGMRGMTKQQVKEQKRKGTSEMDKEAQKMKDQAEKNKAEAEKRTEEAMQRKEEAKSDMDEARRQANEERERIAKQHGTELAKSREEAQKMLEMTQDEVDNLEIGARSEAEQIRMAMQLSEAKFKLKDAETRIVAANARLEKMQSLPDNYTEEEVEAYKAKIVRAEVAKEALKAEIKKNNRMLQNVNK